MDDRHTKYNRSPKAKEAQKRYSATDHGKQVRRLYVQRNKDKVAEIQRKYRMSAKGKAVRNKNAKDYAKRYPEKIKASTAVNCAILAGKLPSPKVLLCECGNPAEHYHHPDYSKPLEVIPVCHKCHKDIEQAIRVRRSQPGRSHLGERRTG